MFMLHRLIFEGFQLNEIMNFFADSILSLPTIIKAFSMHSLAFIVVFEWKFIAYILANIFFILPLTLFQFQTKSRDCVAIKLICLLCLLECLPDMLSISHVSLTFCQHTSQMTEFKLWKEKCNIISRYLQSHDAKK